MTRAAAALCAVLQELSPGLPFELIDRYECWATDYQGRPVALLASTEDPDRTGDLHPRRWQATRLVDHDFVSASLQAQGIPPHGDLGPREHAERLERQVRRLGQHKAWFRRTADDRGERLTPTAGAAEVRVALPPLGLTRDWDLDIERALAEDYIAWLAPRLLLLQHLDDDTRARLEVLACRQAVEVAAAYRLLPRIVDRERIDAARVEARLRQA